MAKEQRLYKIGEVCKTAGVQPYVLRYWETEFPPLAPGKSGGGQRQYTEHELSIILRIKELLYTEGFTIAGAKKKLEAELADPQPEPVEETPRPQRTKAMAVAEVPPISDDHRVVIRQAKEELRSILEMLRD